MSINKKLMTITVIDRIENKKYMLVTIQIYFCWLYVRHFDFLYKMKNVINGKARRTYTLV